MNKFKVGDLVYHITMGWTHVHGFNGLDEDTNVFVGALSYRKDG